ncbi:MAG: DNA gyrase subunit A, partial [Phormidesmis sp. CAN_BIN44]|nr:DNA gyrase subunit A [Phormidesmis sp. CAN_BIN44]
MTFSQEIPTERIVPTDLRGEMQRSYLEYAMSVIVGRALPDARDGLKPVHRRILYAMHELGLTPERPFRKCARVVGEVLGKYHPHGDTAVYDALVRMAQDFSMRERLINGHGNFGSIDNDPPAAMRYTECRLTTLTSNALLRDIESETVDFADNFDGSQQEPTVLPARLPQLLLNGSSGIAVGMATNIPPHNLGELIDGLTALIHNPDLTELELMQYIPGPDFPTGGQILGRSGMRDAYTTGRGSITMRGVASIETIEHRGRPDREAIIITELPYQTNKASLIEKIAELVNDRKIDGISDVRDESDRDGMRIVIELRRDAYPRVVLNNLYKQTPIQANFG